MSTLKYLGGVRSETKVLDGFTMALWAAEKDDVRSGGRAHCELVKSQALTTSLDDASTGGCREAQGGDCELWDHVEAVVVRHCADHSTNLALVPLDSILFRCQRHNFRQADRWTVGSAWKCPLLEY